MLGLCASSFISAQENLKVSVSPFCPNGKFWWGEFPPSSPVLLIPEC